MSHGAGLVRTTCSTGGAGGPRAGAGPPGTSASEGVVDPVYPRTLGALLKVAQMVRGGAGSPAWPREGGVRLPGPGGAARGWWSLEPGGTRRSIAPPAAGAPLPGWREPSSRKVGWAAPARELRATPGPCFLGPISRSQVLPAAAVRGLPPARPMETACPSSLASSFLSSGRRVEPTSRGRKRRPGRGAEAAKPDLPPPPRPPPSFHPARPAARAVRSPPLAARGADWDPGPLAHSRSEGGPRSQGAVGG